MDWRRLFFALYFTVSLLTIFTSNDIIILTFTPFIYYLTKNADIIPAPYLIGEFFAANTWSMMLYIGNPTNILLAAAFGVHFDKYLQWMFLPTLAAGTANMLLIYALFRKEITRPIRQIDQHDPLCAITDRTGALMGLCLLGGCIIALAGTMWMSILGDKDCRISFKEFTWYGILVTPITLITCLTVLAVTFMPI